MADEKFDAIIVGAGPAGSTAAYVLAQAGCEVLLIEKGNTPGSKNVSGGRMYSHALNRIIPNFWEEAPVERPVTREIITFLHGDRSVSLDYHDFKGGSPPYHSFTVLRTEFDAWLAAKAEEAGAVLACAIRVDEVLKEDGRVVGIRAGEDEMLAEVVIAADGANSITAQQAGLSKLFTAHQVATGVKQVIELPPEVINQRFQVDGTHGAAQLFVGDCTKGLQGGGFLYTNKSSLSLGLVVSTAALQRCEIRMSEILEEFKESPHIAPLIAGGQPAEYSAHLIPEAGLGMLPQLFGDGILVAGDAAGLVLNLGYIVRGMDFAVASGEAAAKAVLAAKARSDLSRQGLAVYQNLLKESFVLRDLEAYRNAPAFQENRRLFNEYPRLVAGLVGDLFRVDGTPPVHLLAKAMSQIKESRISLWQLAVDGWKGARSL